MMERWSEWSTSLEMLYNTSGDCLGDLNRTIFSAEPFSPYRDATGKPGSGVRGGNFLWLGDYEACDRLEGSLYCLADLDATVRLPGDINATGEFVRWGLCAPSSCNETLVNQSLASIIQETLHLSWLTVNDSTVNCAQSSAWTAISQAAIIVLLCLAGLNILGTILHALYQHTARMRYCMVWGRDNGGPMVVNVDSDDCQESDPPTSPSTESIHRPPDRERMKQAFRYKPGNTVQFFTCFSLLLNLKQLSSVTSRHGTKEEMIGGSACWTGCLHGLRVISMLWIILANTYLVMVHTGNIDNPARLVASTSLVSWSVVASADYAVDTFLFISGFLAALRGLQHTEECDGRFPVFTTYVHRYIRLVPLVVGSMLLWMGVKPLLGGGPLWFAMQSDAQCDSYWWTNLLFIQNFYPSSHQMQCMGWLWYLAVDTQLFIITPPIIILLHRFGRRSLWGLGLLAVASVVTTAALTAVYDIQVNLAQLYLVNNLSAAEVYERMIWVKPYCRLVPYIAGLALSWFMFTNKPGRVMPRVKVSHLCIWLLAAASGLSLVYGISPSFHGRGLGVIGNVIYGSLGHVCWALILTWLIYTCLTGIAGPIESILGWEGWRVPSRLTYAVYLIHPIITHTILYSRHTPIHYSTLTTVSYYLSFVVLSYGGASILHLLLEQPFLNAERLFRKGNIL